MVENVRINLLGASGCGTSTVGRSVASALSLPHFESDDYFHAPTDPPFQKQWSGKERHDLICNDLAVDKSWVLSGGIAGWEPYPELELTLVVFLYVPTEERMRRLRNRERERFGRRLDPGGDMHQTHEEFIQWASRYDQGDIEGKTLARHEAYLSTLNCPVIQFRGQKTLTEITEKVLEIVS